MITSDYYKTEERVATLRRSWERKRRYVEGNLYEEVRITCESKGYDCPTLLMNAYARKIKGGDLSKTCEVIGELIKHIVKGFEWHCIIQRVFKEFGAEENTFWIECEFTLSSTEKRGLEKKMKDTKEVLTELWKNTSEKEIDLLVGEAEKMMLLKIERDMEESVEKIVEAKFLINIKFGSPP